MTGLLASHAAHLHVTGPGFLMILLVAVALAGKRLGGGGK